MDICLSSILIREVHSSENTGQSVFITAIIVDRLPIGYCSVITTIYRYVYNNVLVRNAMHAS